MKLLLALAFVIMQCRLAESVRIVTEEELATKTTKTGDVLWLSIMGEVYDVSAGTDYYSEGKGYSIFAGRDATVSFVTGKFNEEEASKSIEILTDEQIGGIESWRGFYETEERYPFVGLLKGYLYDENGNPSELLQRVQTIAAAEKVKAEIKEKERKARVAAKRAQREAQKKKDASTSEL